MNSCSVRFLAFAGKLAIVLSVLSVAPAFGQIVWENTTSPSPLFQKAPNWVGGVAPGTGDEVLFSSPDSYQVSWDDDTESAIPAVSGLSVTAGDVTFRNVGTNADTRLAVVGSGFLLSGVGTQLSIEGLEINTGFATIGSGSVLTVDPNGLSGSRFSVGGSMNVDGTVIVRNGGTVQVDSGTFVGTSAGTNGQLSISGIGSNFSTDAFSVGSVSSGDVSVTDGGMLTTHGVSIGFSSTGMTTIDNASWVNTSFLALGDYGIVDFLNNSTVEAVGFSSSPNGFLTLSSGAQFQIADTMFAEGVLNASGGSLLTTESVASGWTESSNATSTFSGSGTTWNNSGSFFIGEQGRSTLTLEDGAALTTGLMSIGQSDSGIGVMTVKDATTRFTNSGSLDIGAQGTGTLNITDGATAEISGATSLGSSSNFASGTINVIGSGSRLDLNGTSIGGDGDGTLSVEDAGIVTSQSANVIGRKFSTATISGSGSQWLIANDLFVGSDLQATVTANNSGFVDVGGNIFVGDNGRVEADGVGALIQTNEIRVGGLSSEFAVRNGARATAGSAFFEGPSESTGTLTVQGAGSEFSANALHVGSAGSGESGNVSISGGGIVTLDSMSIHSTADTGNLVLVDGTGSAITVADQLTIGNTGNSQLRLTDGGSVNTATLALGTQSGISGTATVNGIGSNLSATHATVGEFGIGTMSVEDGGNLSISNMTIGLENGSSGSLVVSGADSVANVDFASGIGVGGGGHVQVESGGRLETRGAVLGASDTSSGSATVAGAGSTWNAAGMLSIGQFGGGTLSITDGGIVTSESTNIAEFSGMSATAFLDGIGSRWDINGDLAVGITGEGSLALRAGAVVTNQNASIATDLFVPDSISTASVQDVGSHWHSSGNLDIGVEGQASLFISNGGAVTVDGETRIGNDGRVLLNNGQFDFGRTSLTEFNRIEATSGSLAGNVVHSSFTDVATMTNFQSSAIDISGVALENQGTLYGSASLLTSLDNGIDGEVQTFAGDFMRFEGSGANHGEIDSFGGTLRIEGRLFNESTGFIGGRGVLIASGGIENAGVMAFTGTTDVLGDIEMLAGSKLITSGRATTTLFDDVVFNDSPTDRAEIRTSDGSSTVVLGGISGDLNFTGSGDVFAEGDLRPGNSPGLGIFEGNLSLGDSAMTFIELSGEDFGEFDQLAINGNFFVDGALDVALIDGFGLSAGQEFLIADVEGSLAGMFNGLDEGALVGNYGGQNLFITYNGFGGGSGVGLFTTAVPEPGSSGILVAFSVFLISRRRRTSR